MVAVLFKAGLQVPLMLLVDVVGSTASVPPEQMGAICVNAGVTLGLTVIVMLAVVAHEPGVGVKV
ncbi:hypothetical protein D9M68_836410 [compost metagenome]